ncbi:hypothetical protein B0T10DRAFT_464108 [Thelonectria olida]|uniref:Uncharacterized protein n=1 Tax=Thelonectria olida TaxID=1576542 RepID=A0A9P9AKU4_9HYPO|nr:hypothetical protein B0T10DRAFT_464108 [Thelonectria olida]
MLPSVRPIPALAALLSTFKFPNCEKADSVALKCSDLSKEETIKCFCTQELLDAYVGCKGEFRQCILGNSYDSSVDDLIDIWQDACGPYLSDDITTPAASEATRTLDVDTCQTIAESCGQLSASITSCSSSYDRPAEITSCRCQASLVSLASVCDIDGRKSCIGETVITSNIWEFRNCEAATDVLHTSEVRYGEADFKGITLIGEQDEATIPETPGASTAEDMASTLTFGLDSTAISTTTNGGAFMRPNRGWRASLLLLLTFIYFSEELV